MARIRTIKPEFPQSESMGAVSRESRLCFILLWTLADDAGRLRGNSRMLASLLYPYDDDAKKHMDGWLGELEAQSCILRYSVNGDTYIQIAKWAEHQKIDKPSPSKIPEPSESNREPSRTLANPREDSIAEGKGREGIKEGKGKEGKDAAAAAMLPDVDAQVRADWLALRKQKRLPLTQTAIDGIRAEVAKAGLSMDAALRICCRKGWASFDAAWDWRSAQRNNGPPPESPKHAEQRRILESIGVGNGRSTGDIIDSTAERVT